MNDVKKKNSIVSFSYEFTQALVGIGALGLVYNVIAHSVNSVYGVFTKGVTALPELFSLSLSPSFLGDYLLACLAIGFVTYIVLVLICSSQWVQEPVEVEECWKEKDWWNPFHWIWVIVCTIKEVLKWVLKWVCKWKEVLITVAVIVCIVAVLAA